MRTTEDRIVAIRAKLQDALAFCNTPVADPKLQIVRNEIKETLDRLTQIA